MNTITFRRNFNRCFSVFFISFLICNYIVIGLYKPKTVQAVDASVVAMTAGGSAFMVASSPVVLGAVATAGVIVGGYEVGKRVDVDALRKKASKVWDKLSNKQRTKINEIGDKYVADPTAPVNVDVNDFKEYYQNVGHEMTQADNSIVTRDCGQFNPFLVISTNTFVEDMKKYPHVGYSVTSKTTVGYLTKDSKFSTSSGSVGATMSYVQYTFFGNGKVTKFNLCTLVSYTSPEKLFYQHEYDYAYHDFVCSGYQGNVYIHTDDMNNIFKENISSYTKLCTVSGDTTLNYYPSIVPDTVRSISVPNTVTIPSYNDTQKGVVVPKVDTGSVTIPIDSGTVVDPGTGTATNDYTSHLTGIKGILQGIWDFIKGIPQAIYNLFKDILQALLDMLKSIKDAIIALPSQIGNILTIPIDGVRSAVDSVGSKVGSISKDICNGISSLFIPTKSITLGSTLQNKFNTDFNFRTGFDDKPLHVVIPFTSQYTLDYTLDNPLFKTMRKYMSAVIYLLFTFLFFKKITGGITDDN